MIYSTCYMHCALYVDSCSNTRMHILSDRKRKAHTFAFQWKRKMYFWVKEKLRTPSICYGTMKNERKMNRWHCDVTIENRKSWKIASFRTQKKNIMHFTHVFIHSQSSSSSSSPFHSQQMNVSMTRSKISFRYPKHTKQTRKHRIMIVQPQRQWLKWIALFIVEVRNERQPKANFIWQIDERRK